MPFIKFERLQSPFLLAVILSGTFFVGAGQANKAHSQEEEMMQSMPLSSYSFTGAEGPASDPAFDSVDSVVVEERLKETPESANAEYVHECNTCMGSGFTPSFAVTHERMKGTWAFPDCSHTEEVLFQTDHFSLLHSNKHDLCLEPVIATEKLGSFFGFTTNSGEIFVDITNDGLMRTAIPKDVSDAFKQGIRKSRMDIEDASEVMGREYASCGFYPKDKAVLTKWVLNFMDDLDRFVETCYVPDEGGLTVSNENRGQCYGYLFDYFDEDKNKALDFEEVGSAMFKGMITHDLMSDCISAHIYERTSKENIMNYTNLMIHALDKNGDIQLTKDELSQLPEKMDVIFNARGKTSYMGLEGYFPFISQPFNFDKSKLKAIKGNSAD